MNEQVITTEVTTNTLLMSVIRLAQLKKTPIDRLAFQEALTGLAGFKNHKAELKAGLKKLYLPEAKWSKKADPAKTPALIYDLERHQWGVLKAIDARNQWVVEWWDSDTNQWLETLAHELTQHHFAELDLVVPYDSSKSPIYRLIRKEMFSHKSTIFDIILGSVLINTIALGVSFYTMQVYDRVVPTGSDQTLLVLTIGVITAILIELLAKNLRSSNHERMIDFVDQRLARSVFTKFLNVRLDQLPKSVGSIASQLRGYETVRNFLTGVATALLVDAPFTIIFLLVLYAIAGWLAFIPLTFMLLCIGTGLYFKGKVDYLAEEANAASNFKTGLLVETVEGAETIKSGQSGWRMLSRWMNVTDEARDYELTMRRTGEKAQFFAASFQQLSYVLLIANGALIVSIGELSMGGLIACSILSGRIMGPVVGIPNHLVQWAHTKAALKSLDQLWGLDDDHAGQQHPVVLDNIHGHYRLDQVTSYYGEIPALKIPKCVIQAGEKVAILGAVGSGKTTLLRLLSGMYKPQEGTIFLDDVDLAAVSKPVLAEHTGFVQQEGRLFAGTLRENLTLGMLDTGDEKLLDVARITGLLEAVIAPHPQGLMQEISEGGNSLSGGQRQLINLTRAFLRHPNIWLLDEPTASMDRSLEQQIIRALKQQLQPSDTMILVTHKMEMVNIVERIIVLARGEIVMDGPREQVLQQLRKPKAKAATEEQTA